jgi:FHA domain
MVPMSEGWSDGRESAGREFGSREFGSREAARPPARAPLRRRRGRRRWVVVGGLAASWLALEIMTGSIVAATIILAVLAALVAAGVAGLRALGVTRDHPWLRQIASRPWRDGQDVLQIVIRHLSDVFVIMPNGSLFAPTVVEVQLNPDDFRSVCERMEQGVVNASMSEAYEEQVAAHQARFAGPGQADVYIIADESVPPGRYHLRQGHPVTVGGPPAAADDGYEYATPPSGYPAWPAVVAGSEGRFGPDGYAWSDSAAGPEGYAWSDSRSGPGGHGGPAGYAGSGSRGRQGSDRGSTLTEGQATMVERAVAPVPLLRLITGSAVAETMMSGARAGRGSVELVLPEVPTVSREHARFTFADGRWWIINQGRNGLTLNDVPVAGERPLGNGDVIRWGTRPDALLSRVEIGAGPQVRQLSSRHGETG